MPIGLLGKKLGMTQIFDASGALIPVTIVQAGPCTVIAKREQEKDGYQALALGFGEQKESRLTKPELGQFKKAGVAPCSVIREFRTEDDSTSNSLNAGETLDVKLFEEGERVDVIGTSKGRGFQGTIKRHNAAPGPKTHGSMYHRRTGAGGASSDPSRTFKGKIMPGHMGVERVTTGNVQIVKRDTKNNLLYIKGSVPGHNNSVVMVRKRTK
jgi:large subunit ribosomal protein L3